MYLLMRLSVLLQFEKKKIREENFGFVPPYYEQTNKIN